MDKNRIFSENRLKDIEKKIDRLINKSDRRIRDPRFIFLDNAGFMDLFKISNNTASNWRKQGKIAYAQINQKVYFRLSDIEKMIEEHTSHRRVDNPKK